MRKVYEYRNKAEAELVVVSPSGRTKFKYKFTGGVMDPKNKIHAKHTTDSPVMQKALENSEYFNKVVFLVGTFGTEPIPQTPALVKTVVKTPVTNRPDASDSDKDAAKTNGRGGRGRGSKPIDEPAGNNKDEQPDNNETKVYDNVTNFGDAASILVSLGDVDASAITTPEGILKVAKEKGISFPNLQ